MDRGHRVRLPADLDALTMAATTTLPSRQRTCHELGICQGRTVPCLDCDRADAPPWSPNEVTCTPMEAIWYWVVVAALCLASVAVMAGAAGYFYHRYADNFTTTTNTMPEPIISLERIQREAASAAAIYSDINDACPYPFFTDAGRAFKKAFIEERAKLAPALANTAQAATKGVAQ